MESRQKVKLDKYLTSTVEMPILQDIMQELEKPERDPRGLMRFFEFDKNVRTINNLRKGMELPGIVGNITNFGVFRYRHQGKRTHSSVTIGRPLYL